MSRFGKVLAWAVLAVVLPASLAGAKDPSQADKRRRLLEELGLDRRDAPAPAPATPAPGTSSSPGAPDAAPPPGGGARVPGRKPAAGDDGLAQPAGPGPGASFRREIHPALVQACKVCHVTGGPAGLTRFLLSGDVAGDHSVVRRFVDLKEPAASALLAKAGGRAHGGGSPWPSGSPAATRAAGWIRGGARLDAGPAAPSAVAASPSRSLPMPAPGSSAATTRLPVPSVAAGAAGASVAAPLPAAAPVAEAAPAAPIPIPPLAAGQTPSGTVAADADIHPLLMSGCALCHAPQKPAAMTRFVLTGDAAPDLAAARALVDGADLDRSPLLVKAAGEMHGGGAPFPAGGAQHNRLRAWVLGSARAPTATAGSDSAVSAPVAPGPRAAGPAAVAPLPAAAPPAGHARGGLGLPYGFQLNGRFDIDAERNRFNGDPWASGSANALRSYHHFLFLSRQEPASRFGLTVEILNLLFWEGRIRLSPADRPWQLAVAAGKIMVPFGADPLFHQSYGGTAGFDQRVLPAVWASEGAAIHFVFHRRELAVSDDAFVVRGHALRRGDAVLNLQSDLSADDDSKLALGNRLGFSWGPLSAWYSALFNPLGFDRRLFLQAVDVTLWRMRGIPVLEHLSLGVGALRADVSGGAATGFGGPGKDYYHFASYVQVRVHPFDWCYLQYRSGVRTFDNRRGTFTDESRLTADDGSTHNFGAVARWRGLSGGVFYFINLEKVNEVANDLLRVSVAYEF